MHGIERSDSLVWNLHKMMGITQQCTVLLVKDPTQLAPVFSTKANYIFQADKQFGEYDAGDRTFHCGRRVDVLKAWLTWKTFGDAGFAERVDHAVGLADHTRATTAERDDFAVLVPGSFTNVCFVWVPPELPALRSCILVRRPARPSSRRCFTHQVAYATRRHRHDRLPTGAWHQRLPAALHEPTCHNQRRRRRPRPHRHLRRTRMGPLMHEKLCPPGDVTFQERRDAAAVMASPVTPTICSM